MKDLILSHNEEILYVADKEKLRIFKVADIISEVMNCSIGFPQRMALTNDGLYLYIANKNSVKVVATVNCTVVGLYLCNGTDCAKKVILNEKKSEAYVFGFSANIIRIGGSDN